MLAPRSFLQTIDKHAYASACVTADARNGWRRFTIPAMMLAVLSIAAGVTVMFGGETRSVELLLKGLPAVLTGCGIAALFAVVLPDSVKTRAEARFAVYDALSNNVTVTMTADEMTLKTERLTRRVVYANIKICIETPDRFVLVAEDDRLVILEKACFADREDTVLFFRDVFARRYTKGR